MKSQMHRIRTYLFLILLGISCMATTQAQEVQVTSADPSSAEQGTVELDVEITGNGFNHSAVVEFFPTGTSAPGGIKVKKVKVRGPKKLIATIDVESDAAVADFDIEIRLSSGRRGRGTTLFSVKMKSTDRLTTELIVFTGDLQGWAHVEGCCPNAGPNPRYTITLPSGLYDSAGYEIFPPGTYDGYLFMNGYGTRRVNEYIIQFHACCIHEDSVDLCKGVLPEMKFEIIGGRLKSVGHKKTKGLVVTFDDVPWWKDYNREIDMGPVSFEMTRVPSRYCTPDICPPQP